MKYLLLVFLLFFTACSVKEYQRTQTKIVIIKSPKLKFADVGYIRNSKDSLELELFMAGTVVEKISINHLVCVSAGCMSKQGFNNEYLNGSYPSDILQNILLAKPIYDAKNRVKTEDGFEQYIKDEKVDIKYKVTSNITYFKDRKNKIIFKIKDIK
ncbi:MAG: hypothetical protein U9N02_06715 [Campylobacterota bacterium]|nr:hypothetical protein [Campylobacterota bacterium]